MDQWQDSIKLADRQTGQVDQVSCRLQSISVIRGGKKEAPGETFKETFFRNPG